jgi:hypothetical protein
VRWHDSAVVEHEFKTLSFRATEESRISERERGSPDEGTYRVLATLDWAGRIYRVFGDLNVGDGDAHLRLYRFELPQADEWYAERKVNITVPWPEIAPLKHKLNGAEFRLCTAVHLDATQAAALFGSDGPPMA